MFDTQIEYGFKDVPTTKGRATIVVRWPTDEEWEQRTRATDAMMIQLGRGISELEMDTRAADAKLYEVIRLENSPDLTPAEATFLIDSLAKTDITSVAVEGDEAIISLKIVNDEEVKHRLRVPSIGDVMEIRRYGSRNLQLPHNRTRIKMSLEKGTKLWDRCRISTEGYANGVPAIHKDGAIRQLVEQINNSMAPNRDETNF